jgi:hypothetical protein
MNEASEQAPAERPKPRGDAAWKAHLQEIAAKNERVSAAGRQERREREELAASQRRAVEIRMDADLARTLGRRYSN